MDFSHIDEGHGEGEEPLHFYYSREERLKNAPEIVREYYAGRGPRPVKGLFRALTATRGNRFLLASVAFFAAFVWIFSLLSGRNDGTVGGVPAKFSAFLYEDSVYVSLSLRARGPERDAAAENARGAAAAQGAVSENARGAAVAQSAAAAQGASSESGGRSFPVRAVFTAWDADGQVAGTASAEDFYDGAELFLRTKFRNYDIIRVTAEVTAGGETKELRTGVEKY